MINDLAHPGDHFPLGELVGDPGPPGSRTRPFGLLLATAPAKAATVDLDWSRISYDSDRQIAIVADDDGTVLPAMRHTSTKTKTTTNIDDRSPPDSDTDYTGR